MRMKIANGQGRIHVNVLWEMGGCEARAGKVLLQGAKGMVHGVTCGAGMPYKLGEICAGLWRVLLSDVSSARAFSALWKRAYSKNAGLAWRGGCMKIRGLAGGHNGLSNSEDPNIPQDPLSPRGGAAQK